MVYWATAFCPGIELLLKTDDDTFIVPYRMAEFLSKFQENGSWPENSVMCESHGVK